MKSGNYSLTKLTLTITPALRPWLRSPSSPDTHPQPVAPCRGWDEGGGPPKSPAMNSALDCVVCPLLVKSSTSLVSPSVSPAWRGAISLLSALLGEMQSREQLCRAPPVSWPHNPAPGWIPRFDSGLQKTSPVVVLFRLHNPGAGGQGRQLLFWPARHPPPISGESPPASLWGISPMCATWGMGCQSGCCCPSWSRDRPVALAGSPALP